MGIGSLESYKSRIFAVWYSKIRTAAQFLKEVVIFITF